MTQDILPTFNSWLKNRNYNKNTSRNYLSDVRKYIKFAHRHLSSTNHQPTISHILTPSVLTAYLTNISAQTNSSRYLASLNKFCQFALDQQLISQNPLKSLRRQLKHTTTSSSTPTQNTSLEDLIGQFQLYLTQKKKSPSTIKNYINDLQQYINWLENEKTNGENMFFSARNHVGSDLRVPARRSLGVGGSTEKNRIEPQSYET